MPENKKDFETSWLEGEVPLSTRFDDPYYSKADGLAESRHVFIAGNRLEARMASGEKIVIGELGFGTGLNFLATWRAWQAHRTDGASLTYHSIEAYPLSAEEIARALSPWPELAVEADELIKAWGDRDTDTSRFGLELPDGVNLFVHFGLAEETLAAFPSEISAWFLDGFSPAKNPQMWSENLMRLVFEHTAAAGTFATYTAAGWVRRNLVAAGFEVEKTAGHAGKRDMTIGRKPA